MKRYVLAAAALAAIASPAAARDGSGYVGIEGGILFPEDTDFDLRINGAEFSDAFEIDYKHGIDLDLIAGYDFGMIRAEGELGWKRAKVDSVVIDGERFDDPDDDYVSVLSVMGNVLLDFGGNDSWGGYVGGGLGWARTKISDERDSGLAWQIIAGVRTAISSDLDLGLKYRYFSTGRLNFRDNDDFDLNFDARGRFRSHSLLASLIYNFGAPRPAPVVPVAAPPPPPPPATQTCPDGSVILATEFCPAPPPPPPPPPPAPERG